jgi:hypothetical protein
LGILLDYLSWITNKAIHHEVSDQVSSIISSIPACCCYQPRCYPINEIAILLAVIAMIQPLISNMASPREAEELKLRTLFFMGPAANTVLKARLRDRRREKLELALHENTENADAKDDSTLKLSNWFQGFRKSYKIICDHRLWNPRNQSNLRDPYSVTKLFAPDSTGFDAVFRDNPNVMCETSKKRCGSGARPSQIISISWRLANRSGCGSIIYYHSTWKRADTYSYREILPAECSVNQLVPAQLNLRS